MRGLLNFEFPFRVSTIYCNSNRIVRSTHPRVILYYNERIFREFVLSKEKKKNWKRKIYLEPKFEFLGKIESQFSNPRFYSNYADRIAFPVA